MKKSRHLNQIQKRLPDDLIIHDETNFEFTDDEYVVILSWIKFFNKHYQKHQKNKLPEILFPIISKRLRLDFGLYITPNDLQENHGKHIIYLCPNAKMLNGTIKKNISVKDIVDTWSL